MNVEPDGLIASRLAPIWDLCRSKICGPFPINVGASLLAMAAWQSP